MQKRNIFCCQPNEVRLESLPLVKECKSISSITTHARAKIRLFFSFSENKTLRHVFEPHGSNKTLALDAKKLLIKESGKTSWVYMHAGSSF